MKTIDEYSKAHKIFICEYNDEKYVRNDNKTRRYLFSALFNHYGTF